MKDAILVLNSGSSSVKFSLFVVESDGLELEIRGQLDGLLASPQFVARDPVGKVIAEKSWEQGARLGHEGALEHLREFLLGRGGAHAKEKLRVLQLECQACAYEHDIDKPEMDGWTWPANK